MRGISVSKSITSALLLSGSVFVLSCSQVAVGGGEDKNDTENHDITEALAALPDATVLSYTPDGVPTYIIGEMGKVGAMQSDDAIASDAALRPSLTPVLAAFRLKNPDLALRKMNVDADGGRHFRYDQQFNGLPVIGSELVVHVDVKGAVIGVNGTARGDISPALGSSAITQAQAMSTIAQDVRFTNLSAGSVRLLYIETDDGQMHKAYEAVMSGQRGADPARDKVYVDVDTRVIVAVYPQIHFAENRKVYSANNGTSIPGTLKRSEGQAATTDVDVNAAYDNTGAAYEAYKNFFNRDSYNNAGATLTSSVHYSTNAPKMSDIASFMPPDSPL